jgi:hypothetical protein
VFRQSSTERQNKFVLGNGLDILPGHDDRRSERVAVGIGSVQIRVGEPGKEIVGIEGGFEFDAIDLDTVDVDVVGRRSDGAGEGIGSNAVRDVVVEGSGLEAQRIGAAANVECGVGRAQFVVVGFFLLETQADVTAEQCTGGVVGNAEQLIERWEALGM